MDTPQPISDGFLKTYNISDTLDVTNALSHLNTYILIKRLSAKYILKFSFPQSSSSTLIYKPTCNKLLTNIHFI